MRKIRILQIIGDSTLSGAPISLLTLVKNLDKKKFDITCLCPPGPLAGLLKEVKGVGVEIVPMRSKWDFKAIKKIRKIIKSLSPCIVHCHGLRGGFLGRLACIGPQKTAPKVVYTEHLWTAEYRLKNPISHWFQLFSLWFLDLFTNKIIAVSKAVADFLVKKKITRPEKLMVIYNGTDIKLKTKNEKRKTTTKNSEVIIGFVGSLTKRKGVEYLIRAIPLIILNLKSKILNLVIVGEGEEKEKLQKLTKKLKLEKFVEFWGLLDDTSTIYPVLDVYVQPSLDEAFGIAVLEAMSFGVPVVASQVGGLSELLNHKPHKSLKLPYEVTDCGILVPPKNSAALAKAIVKVLKDEKLAKKIGKAGQKRALEFSADRMVKETEKLYSSFLE
jgi:glycosyltransferase involved in cell wall biosynthesis